MVKNDLIDRSHLCSYKTYEIRHEKRRGGGIRDDHTRYVGGTMWGCYSNGA